MEENDTRPPLFGLIVLFIGAAFITVGVVFLTYGLYHLIRNGIWPAYPFSKMLTEIGFPLPHLTWPSGQRAIDWVLSSSACTVLLAIGAVISGTGAWLIARHNRRLRQAADAAEAAA
jgi:hypothetical protein